MRQSIMTMLLLFFLLGKLSAQQASYYEQQGIAIRGYDPVAYFTEQKALKGSERFQYDWEGVSWRFISEENRSSFRLMPEKYAPQYGGFCAYGCSEGHKAATDPTAWTIVGQKLYLNYNKDVRSLWVKDTIGRIRLADSLWINQKIK